MVIGERLFRSDGSERRGDGGARQDREPDVIDCRADHAGDGGGHRDVDARQCDARQRGAWFRQRSDLHGAGELAGHDYNTAKDQHGDTASGQVAITVCLTGFRQRRQLTAR